MYTWHLHTTLGRELTTKADTEQAAVLAVQGELQPGDRVNEAWIEPSELSAN
jgi:hypothetical protein